MNQLIIEQGKKKYIFSSDKIVVIKKNEVIQEIFLDEIDEVTFNPKYGFRDFFTTLFITIGLNYSYYYKAFAVYLRPEGCIHIKMSKENFEKVKSFFKIPIRIV